MVSDEDSKKHQVIVLFNKNIGKTIRDSQKECVSLKEFTERYTKYFFEDIEIK